MRQKVAESAPSSGSTPARRRSSSGSGAEQRRGKYRGASREIWSQTISAGIHSRVRDFGKKAKKPAGTANRRWKTGSLDEADVSLEGFLKDLRACKGAAGEVRLGKLLLRLRVIARRHLPVTSNLRIGLDSEDLAQEGVVHLLSNIDRFRGTTWGEFFAFAAAIVEQQAAAQARWQRVRKPELRSQEDAQDHARHAQTPSNNAESKEDKLRLHRLLATLSEPYRAALELRLAGKSNLEIAAILGCREDLVRKRLSRALAILQGQW